MARSTRTNEPNARTSGTDDERPLAPGAAEAEASAAISGAAKTEDKPAPEAPPVKATKLDRIRTALGAPDGASLATLCEATCWQTHSVRAALTGLRKAGAVIEKTKGEDGTTVYRLVTAAVVERS